MDKKRNRLPHRLKSLREEKGISQYKLAERLGVSRGLLSNYEQGSREPDYDTLILIADYYGVSADYLLGLTDVKGRLLDCRKQMDYQRLFNDIANLSPQSLAEVKRCLELVKMWEALHRSDGKAAPSAGEGTESS